MNDFSAIQKEITNILSTQLDKKLCYHNTAHTLDVITQAGQIAPSEGVSSKRDLSILKTAALFHDTGFLYTYNGHEQKSCEIAQEKLKPYFSDRDRELICGLIMATKVPQNPSTLLEQIICDADLDYLGRSDFNLLSNFLKSEFLDFGIVKNEREWEKKQIVFFETHRYFTRTSIEKRQPLKLRHLDNLKQHLKNNQRYEK